MIKLKQFSALPIIAPSDPIIRTKTSEKIVIHCTIKKGTGPFKIDWMKDGIFVASNDNIRISGDEEISNLIIKSTEEADTGNYTCVAKNAFGSDSFTSQLVIEGRLNHEAQ